ncbi:helix-turn-helix transcriptional regulator [Chroococcidiopsis sp. FACHB-1243]|uniref:PadR family transcriptional regulator n=1 Tax=Chroococcidiopsis sp. [FACHB-1243] TaxID=2692781 RepID=UPI00178457C0|nr:PadR family transcriptional regulator [Chroococcidiopsis sp. [FACHB-1243]]MBD2309391.1 helix-turn-helix transcriptional regulator [Chroococcidiopsis sp. [FACHB-1243]]
MRLEDIYQFFTDRSATYLTQEQAVCYVLSVLLEGESYGTELIQKLESDYPPYRLSDSVLYAALNFLETEQALASHLQKVEGRGRPRRMYQVSPQWFDEAQKLAALWTNSVARKPQASKAVAV